MADARYIQQLINTHKLSYIIIPLMEAVEINKRSGELKNLKTSDLLNQVIQVGTDVYNKLLDNGSEVVESGLISDKLFLSLSVALRNNIVLYNNDSLSLIKDDVLDVFGDELYFLQHYQSNHLNIVNKEENNNKTTKNKINHDVRSYVLSSMVDAFTPIWMFHINLFISGYLQVDKLTELNKTVLRYILNIMKEMVDHTSKKQGDVDEYFRADSIKICSKIIAQGLIGYQNRIIKKKEDINGYINEPMTYLEKIAPMFYANYSALNQEVFNIIKDLSE